jgi:hypothetical protein
MSAARRQQELDNRMVPCPRCGVGFVEDPDSNGFLPVCRSVDMRSKGRRRGRENERPHNERAELAARWRTVGKPPLVGALGFVRAAIVIRNDPLTPTLPEIT